MCVFLIELGLVRFYKCGLNSVKQNRHGEVRYLRGRQRKGKESVRGREGKQEFISRKGKAKGREWEREVGVQARK